MSLSKPTKEWKKLVKINFDGLGGIAYGKGEIEMRVETLGLAFIQQTINQEVKEALKRIERAIKTRSILKIEEAIKKELKGG